MIIALSGKKGSGKDLVSSIIDYLSVNNISFHEAYPTFEECTKHVESFGLVYENKKFADKLKDIVCLLIGCTRDQLEDQTFKETPLGDEWKRWKVVDNDPDASGVCQYFDSEKDALDSLKCEGDDYGSCFAYYKPTITEEILTPRLLLQLIGTDLFRDKLHPNIWVNSLMSEYQPESRWIISDLRFKNEINAVKQQKGITIRINRNYTSQEWSLKYPDVVVLDPDGWDRSNFKHSWYEEKISLNEYKNRVFASTVKDLSKIKMYNYFNEHKSEKELDNYQYFDYTIDNDGTINELVEKIKTILKDGRIIK